MEKDVGWVCLLEKKNFPHPPLLCLNFEHVRLDSLSKLDQTDKFGPKLTVVTLVTTEGAAVAPASIFYHLPL